VWKATRLVEDRSVQPLAASPLSPLPRLLIGVIFADLDHCVASASSRAACGAIISVEFIDLLGPKCRVGKVRMPLWAW